MFKVRASNLTGKGVIEKILVHNQQVSAGDELALVSTVNGKIVISSPYDGMITKLALPGTKLKNGTVIANILNDKLAQEEKKIMSGPLVSSSSFGKVSSKWKEIKDEDFNDEISGFSFSGSKSDTPIVNNELNLNNSIATDNNSQTTADTIKNQNKKEDSVVSTPFASKDTFNKIRNNIRTAVEKSTADYKTESEMLEKLKAADYHLLSQSHNYNTPDNKYNKPTEGNALTSAADIILNRNYNDNADLKPQALRDIVLNRKDQLHSQNNFKDLEKEPGRIVNSMDDLDEDGRPKILRNLINKRLENFRIKNMLGEHIPTGDDVIGKKSEGYTLEDLNKTSQSHSLENTSNSAILNKKDELEYIDMNGNVIVPNSNKTNNEPAFNLPYYEKAKKLNSDRLRDAIYEKNNLRNLIEERRKQIALGVIVSDENNSPMNFSRRPSADELARQIENPNYIPSYINGTNADKMVYKSEEDIRKFNKDEQIIQGSWKEKNNLLENVCTQIEEKADRINTIAEHHSYAGIKFVRPFNRTGNIDFDLFEAEKYYFYLKDVLKKIKHFEYGKTVSTAYSGRPYRNNPMTNDDEAQMNSLNGDDTRFLINKLKSENSTDNSINKLIQVMTLKFLSENMIKKDEKVAAVINNIVNDVTSTIDIEKQKEISSYTIKKPSSPYNKSTKYKKMAIDIDSANTDFFAQETSLSKDVSRETEVLEDKTQEFISRKTEQTINNEPIPEWYKKMTSVSKKINPKNFIVLRSRIDISFIMKLISSINKLASKQHRFTTMTFIAKAISQTLEFYPKLNGIFDKNKNTPRIKHDHNIGIVTKHNENYLLPMIAETNSKSLLQIATDMNKITGEIKKGNSFVEEKKLRTVTIVNINESEYRNTDNFKHHYNMLTFFVDNIQQEMIKYKQKNTLRPTISITMEVHEDIISLEQGADFLNKLKHFLEHPQNLL